MPICYLKGVWIIELTRTLFFLYNILSLIFSMCPSLCLYPAIYLLYLLFWNVLSLYSCRLLVLTSSCFPIFMMNGDFWGLQHCSGQSFINKCNYAKQVNLINVEMTVTLSRSFSRHPRTILYSSKFFHESSTSTQSSAYRSLTFLVRTVSSLSPWSKVRLLQRGRPSEWANQYQAYSHLRPSITWA